MLGSDWTIIEIDSADLELEYQGLSVVELLVVSTKKSAFGVTKPSISTNTLFLMADFYSFMKWNYKANLMSPARIKLLVTAVLICCSIAVFAQEQFDINAFINDFRQSKVLRDYIRIRPVLIEQLESINGLENVNSETLAELESSYTIIKNNFDTYLQYSKTGILNLNRGNPAVTNEINHFERAVESYNAAVDQYNNFFLPKYNSLHSDRFVLELLVPLGISIVSTILDRFSKKGVSFEKSALLSQLNLGVVNKLTLPAFNSIVHTPGVNDLTDRRTANAGRRLSDVNLNESSMVSSSADYFKFSVPAASNLSGSIVFVMENGSNMYFRDGNHANEYRDLIIRDNQNIDSEFPECTMFSMERYSSGQAFQVRVENKLFTYAVTQNSDGKCTFLYPYDRAWIDAYSMSQSRDLVIGDLMMVNDSVLTIPSRNSSTGKENYIIITGNSPYEQLSILISNAELNIGTVNDHLNQLEGKLFTRLDSLSQTDCESGIYADNGSIAFNRYCEGPCIIPINFIINK